MEITPILFYVLGLGSGCVLTVCYLQWKEEREYKKWQDDQPQIPDWLRPQAD